VGIRDRLASVEEAVNVQRRDTARQEMVRDTVVLPWRVEGVPPPGAVIGLYAASRMALRSDWGMVMGRKRLLG
jgi:hypothetical protein